ncbi:hypothetical protein [Streptomyces sp. NBC_01408]|uniref:hypothetical protein n=1 Tax=Streptomyces sp. NBC_01408 TaxID=2903855 RepID=UPI002258CE64|nr:hypothetical protein [Streptomyces sp. NBC_01408]MCX4696575.1 hypothetical protein [Streptomyces sp. NBC_01408]
MRAKLAALISIFSVALALGLGVAGGLDSQADGTTTGHVVLADDKGPFGPAPAPSPKR